MVGIYFSGTGNTKHCLNMFVQELDSAAEIYSIEDNSTPNYMRQAELILFAYPVYYSNLPKIVTDFIVHNRDILAGKKIFIIATMGLFSGDGAGCSARRFKKYDADVIGGLHLKMPDCIGDEKVLKKSIEQNKAIVKKAEEKIRRAAVSMKQNSPPQDGIGFVSQIAGLLGQRLWFYTKTKHYSDKVKIARDKCIGCGICVEQCPMRNLSITNQTAVPKSKCTMCYRCISNCPKQAITLLGTAIYEQCKIENYL